jgi:hypothetical protein
MRILMLAATMALTATAAAAQSTAPADRNQRQGFWIGLGLGAGSAGVDCGSCSTDRSTALSGHLRLGGTLSQSLLLGFESNAWVDSDQGVDQTLGFGSAVLIWYPGRTGAFFLKVGVGAMSYNASSSLGDLTATAPAGSLGLGYDFHVGRNMSVTPFFNSLATSEVAFKFNGSGSGTSDLTVNLIQFGVGVTWH